MSRLHRMLGALTLALFLPALATAEDSAAEDRDAKELDNYVLTDAGLAKYSQAARQLAKLEEGQVRACEETEDLESISDTAAAFDRYPAAKSIVQAAGMTTREYVVFSLALLQAGLAAWGAEQSGGQPEGVSPANLAFYQRNEANLKKLETVTKQPYCESEEQYDDEDGQ